MGDYHDLHSKTDALLRTDVFEFFRDMCLSFYDYYILPNFAFDALLKLTGIEIDLVYDQERFDDRGRTSWRDDTNTLQESRSK